MATGKPALYDDVERCVEEAIKTVGRRLVVGLPIAVGKPTHIANEIYRRAKESPDIEVVFCSGLTLRTPGWKSDLERRLIQPLAERLFHGYPNPNYMDDVFAGKLPDNVTLREIYFSPGSAIGNGHLQWNYTSSNFTHVPRDVEAAGCNVVAVMTGGNSSAHPGVYNLGSNADASIMMIKDMSAAIARGQNGVVLGQVNDRMPYMFGDTEADEGLFTGIVDNPKYYHDLFAMPKEPVGTSDYCIGLIASALIKDGGTLQVGFGSLGDAIIYALTMRHENNETYRRLLEDSKLLKAYGHIIEKTGDTGVFEKGLYGCSEFIFDGFLHLIKRGIMKRGVYDNEHLQRVVNEVNFSGQPDEALLQSLVNDRAVGERITKTDFEFLQHYGIFSDDVSYERGMLKKGSETSEANLHKPETREWIISNCLGAELRGETLIHAGFLAGTRDFYSELMNMDDEAKRKIKMCDIGFVNSIYGGQEMKLLQRKDARFINATMMATMLGGVVSDTLETGQVVSGVGGQYNFVCMAHEMPGARSIIVLHASREKEGKPASNIVWNYGSSTIPRHLRDIVVTEYGIADLRGKSDSETIKAMLNIADSRFQNALMAKAKAAGKLDAKYEIPAMYRYNFPEALDEKLKPFRAEKMLPAFPFGNQLTREELVLAKALRGLKRRMSPGGFDVESLKGLTRIFSTPAAAKTYLERMGLDAPKGRGEKVMQKLVLYALAADGVI